MRINKNFNWTLAGKNASETKSASDADGAEGVSDAESYDEYFQENILSLVYYSFKMMKKTLGQRALNNTR